MMNHVTLPALLGDSPLAILAAIGTLRLIHDFTDNNARLHWNTTDHRPVLTSSLATVDEVAEALVDIVRTMPEGVSVPGGPMGFPPPGEAPDKLRVPQGKLHSFAENLFPEISETESATMFSWLTSLITDLAATSEKSDSGSKNQLAEALFSQSIHRIVRQAVNCNHAEETFGARAETPRISPRGPHRLGAGTRCNRRVLGSQSGMESDR